VLPEGTLVFEPRGCDQCHHTGYRGRTGIFELVEVDDDLRELIRTRAAARELREAVRLRGMRSLRAEGLACVARSQTTLAEVMRVT